MSNRYERINQLQSKLDLLIKRQEEFSNEINQLRIELNQLKSKEDSPVELKAAQPQRHLSYEDLELGDDFVKKHEQKPSPEAKKKKRTSVFPTEIKSDLEKFIGENLINKIGIVITIIGVGIGAKYSIDHSLISPLTRIILGYLMGLGLLGFAIRLRSKYENFSAVLLSGSMTIMYFLTFSAYSFYDLIPQLMAFGLMVVFTGFTVLAALNYNRQVIAHIGLVGAYAVPFLLSDGSGRVAALLTYMTIINIGILVIAFKKYWKSLYYAAFGVTWLIYAAWFGTSYEGDEHFGLALAFLILFFIIFYLTFLAYKLLQKELFNRTDILLVLTNSFVVYGYGYAILENHTTGEHLLGVFTLCNAIVHFIVSFIIYRQKLADRKIFYMISGLVLVFITLAIPVQLDGNWVTLLWVFEAALLFWIGRTKQVPIYEKLSYPLMLLALISIGQDWIAAYESYHPEYPELRVTPFLNINFLSSILFVLAFGFILRIDRIVKHEKSTDSENRFVGMVAYGIPAFFLLALYYTFRLEISIYWNQLYLDSELTINPTGDYPNYYLNYDLVKFKTIWVINYSLLFASLLAIANIKKIKNETLGLFNIIFIVLALGAFLTQGLYELSELRESYLEQHLAEYYQRSQFNLLIRYITIGFAAISLFATHFYKNQEFIKQEMTIAYDLILHIPILWVISSELIHWLDITDFSQSYKLGLSILWGVYSLFLISIGIWKKKKHLRIGGFSLFGLTLIKLFSYDISHLNTISKIIVFVSLGILLLIISFLYNKYKHIISDEPKN